ncbi:hypothetical protein [Hyphomicrobium sp.]|uniref:hypothetical protein n=1 Tax=Hyphomicrobium sp. TaxID=82 RepID=UPI002E31BEBD|nr:hypothetical protein [Hyphomicrobium sp.]HEX2840150.1 hypothetical protein [Hyphomicrobium sp.]
MSKSVGTPKSFAARGVAIAVAALAAGYCYQTFFADSAPAFAGPAAAAGELDTSQLPRIAGAKETYASALTTIFVSPDSVAKTTDSTVAGLTEAEWKRYEAPFSSKADNPNVVILTFKKGAQGLNVLITLAPAQDNKTSVSYTAINFANDLPLPKDASDVLFDPDRPYLSSLTTESVDASMVFFNAEMIQRGWSPWSVKDATRKPGGAAQSTDNGLFSYFVRDGHKPLIVLVQRQKDGRTTAKIEPVPESLLTAKPDQKEEKVETAPAQPSAAAKEMHEAFDQLTNDIMKQAHDATAETIAGITAKQAPATPAQPEAPLRALRDTSAPIPLPEAADSIEIDAASGNVDFTSTSSVRALASFYRAEMKAAGWKEQPTVIDKDTMAALRFAKGGKDVSITLMKMGNKAKVSATGSGLVSADAEPESAPLPDAPSTSQVTEKELAIQEIAGLLVPTPNTLNGSEKSLYRVQVNARVPASVAAVLAFYRRELGKRDGWKEAEGAIVETRRAVVTYSTSDGPAILTLSSDKGDTVVALLVRKQAEASKAGMLPKPGHVKLLFGNVLDGEASVTIDKKTVKIRGGLGAKKPDGPTIEISPGKHTFSFKLPGRDVQTDEVEVADGDIWGLMVGPGGVLALQMY